MDTSNGRLFDSMPWKLSNSYGVHKKRFRQERLAQYAVLCEEMAKMFGAEMFGPESYSICSQAK